MPDASPRLTHAQVRLRISNARRIRSPRAPTFAPKIDAQRYTSFARCPRTDGRRDECDIVHRSHVSAPLLTFPQGSCNCSLGMATSSVGAPYRPQDGTLRCLASTCSRNTHASTPHFCRSLPLSHADVLRLTISAGQLCTSSSSTVRRSCASLRPHDWSSKVRGLHALSRRAPVRCPASLIHKCICI